MPGVANIISVDIRPNAPQQQQQRGNGDDSFSSMLPDDSGSDQSAPARAEPRDDGNRPQKAERPQSERSEPVGSAKKEQSGRMHVRHRDADAADQDDATDSSDTTTAIAATDTAATEGAATDMDVATTIAPVAAPAVDQAAIQTAFELNAALTAPTNTSAVQADAIATAAEAISAVEVSAAANIATAFVPVTAPSVPGATLNAGVDVAVDTATPVQTTETTTATPVPTNGTAPVDPNASSVKVDASFAANDQTLAQLVTAASAQAAAKSVKSADGSATQDTSLKADVSVAVGDDLNVTLPIASVDTKVSTPIQKLGVVFGAAKVQADAVTDSTAAKIQTSTNPINNILVQVKDVSVAPHVSAKGNVESNIDLAALDLKIDPALVRFVPVGQINAQTSVAAPGAAIAQVQAQTTGTAGQPVPLTTGAIAVEIVSRAKDGLKQFEIRLDPPELGRIDVRLEVSKNGDVSTKLTADRQDTLDLLQRDHRGLEKALESAGLKTSEGEVSFSLRQQTPDGSSNDRGQTDAVPQQDANLIEDNEQTTASIEQYQWAARLRGGVDIRI